MNRGCYLHEAGFAGDTATASENGGTQAFGGVTL